MPRFRPTLHSLPGAKLLVPIFAIGMMFTTGCDPASDASLPRPSKEVFRGEIYPIMLRDCGFPGCHGNDERFFQVYGPGRFRLDDETDLEDPPTEAELRSSYNRTRSMLVHAGDVLESPLLTKPLEGSGHLGTDNHGRNIYADELDPSFQKLVDWATQELPQ